MSNTRANRNNYSLRPSVKYYEKYCNCGAYNPNNPNYSSDNAYVKMLHGQCVDNSGTVWLNQDGCGNLPTLWEGGGNILQEDPGLSWIN